MDLVEDSTQWVFNVYISLEWLTWVHNNENNMGNCYIKHCEKLQ